MVEHAWPDADVIVLDGYRFGPEVQSEAPSAIPLAVFDDLGEVEISRADLIIDQNLGAERRPSWPAGAEALLGVEYTLLRDEIRRARRTPSVPVSVGDVVVSAGADPPDEWWDLLDQAARLAELAPVRLAGADDVGAVLAGSSLGLMASGSTVWEALCIGVPLVVVGFSPNQSRIARQLGRAGCAVDGGDAHGATPASLARLLRELAASASRRKQLVDHGMQMIDGGGRDRVADALFRLVNRT